MMWIRIHLGPCLTNKILCFFSQEIPDSSNFVDPDTINPDPHTGMNNVVKK